MVGLKTFKDLKVFENKLNRGLCWEDYFLIAGKMFKIFEYGDLNNDLQYVYFYNKKSEQMLKVIYICPSYYYENGIKKQKSKYRFISLEVLDYPKAILWRTDTL